MKTRITKIFGIKYPIILSGMSWISTPELVAAVSNAGGLGILATGVMSAEETLEAIRKTRALTKKPFAANVTLYFPGAEKNAEVIIKEKVQRGERHEASGKQNEKCGFFLCNQISLYKWQKNVQSCRKAGNLRGSERKTWRPGSL